MASSSACVVVSASRAVKALNELSSSSSSSFTPPTTLLLGLCAHNTKLSIKSRRPLHVTSQTTEVAVDPLVKIREGFQKFKSTRFSKEPALFNALAETQSPKYMIFACADSRCDPALTLGLDLGEAFVVRNIASLVPPYDKNNGHTSAGSAIEYAVLHLKVQHILVIGHSRCGGIKALLGMKEDGSNRFSEYIEDWISIAQPASKVVKLKCAPDCEFEEQWATCVKESVKTSLEHVLSYPFVKEAVEQTSLEHVLSYPFVKEAVEQKKLTVHGAYYDFVKGEFDHWDA